MCGRYTNTGTSTRLLAERFAVAEEQIPRTTLERFNMCPTETALIVTGDPRSAMGVRWGLLPWWSKDGKGPQPINARAETVASKPLFANLLKTPGRRCLVIADGWYEWMKPEHPKGEKTPFLYRVDGGGAFAFAGVWARARLGGEEVLSAAILTTGANAVCAPVHDRMPCVLADRDAELAWLSGDVDTAAAVELLAPLEEARVQAAPVDRALFKRVDDDALSLF
jgi:putative SOS response-associated peptidase YedK